MKRRSTQAVILMCAVMLMAPTAMAKPTASKSKKKKTKVVSTAKAKSAAGSSRQFSCLGSGQQRVTERLITGTIDSKLSLTNVTVTRNFQLVDNTLVEQPTVVLRVAKPPSEQDPVSGLIVFRLNERPLATAADVDKLFETYQFNFKNTLPPGPDFEAGLYFTTHIGVAGPAANEYRWSLIASLASGGAYGMKCRYV